MIDAIILALFIWANLSGLGAASSNFNIGIVAAAVALFSLVIAFISYFARAEKVRHASALIAYALLLCGIGILTVQTGQTNSPFLALWMVATIFSGIFGMTLLSFLGAGTVGYIVLLAVGGQLTSTAFLGLMLGGCLPLFISFLLWHSKTNGEKTKDRAYNDLANELNQVSNKSEVVINAISDGVIAVNSNGQIELINPAAEQLVGWAHRDAMGLDYKSVLQMLSNDGHELDKTTDPVFDVLSTNQPKRRNDLQLQTSSGKKLVIEVVVSPIGRAGSGAIIVFRDITKEQAEERAQAEFISTASHEMRTPVASIEGYLGLALNPATATIDAKAHDYITKAHLAAEHLGRLFQDLLDVTKADDGRLQNNPKVIEVVSFTSDVIEGLKPKADEKQLHLFFNASANEKGSGRTIEPIYYVDLDADHLREVLANLVENAIKYTPKGEVVIDIEGDDDHVVISIRDSGIGIPTEDIPHLFQKFYRVDNSDTREIGGTGLGLYLCRRLVEAMGGRIWVESEYKKGSTFSVELPRISHEEAQRLIDATMIPNASGNIPLGEEPAPTTPSATTTPLTMSERQQALATPIIVDHNQPISVSSASIAMPKAAAMVDPLVGTPAPAAAPAVTRPQTATVLPPAWQAVQPVVQKSPAAPVAPIAAPAMAPATVAPQPAVTAPQPVQPAPAAPQVVQKP